MKKKFKYQINNPVFNSSFCFEVETNWDSDMPEYIAEDAADDYHSNHDGWEGSWPLNLYVFTPFGEPLGAFKIERESQPVFSASELKAAAVHPPTTQGQNGQSATSPVA